MQKKIIKIILSSMILFGHSALPVVWGQNFNTLLTEGHDVHEALELLVKDLKNLNQTDAAGWTPLLDFIIMQNLEAIDFLLNKGADSNASIKLDNEYYTPLRFALKSYFDEQALGNPTEQYIAIIKSLLIYNAEIATDQSDGLNETELQQLSQDDQLKSVLHEIGMYRNNDSKDGLVQAVTHNGKNNSAFTKYEWLTSALLNKRYKQIQYAVDKGFFKPYEVLEGLAFRPTMSLDMFNSLWGQIKNNESRQYLFDFAQQNKNQKFLDAVKNYTKTTHALKGSYTKGNDNRVGKDLSEVITSYL